MRRISRSEHVQNRDIMKQLIIFLSLTGFFLSIPVLSQAQDDSTALKKQLNLTGGVYNNHIFRFETVEGSGHYSDGPTAEYGLDLFIPMDDRLWMGLGLYYTKARNVYHSPATDHSRGYLLNHVSEVIHLPVTWRYDITPWFAFKVGMSISIEFPRENSLNQNGLGFHGGLIIHHSPLPWLDLGIEPSIHLTSMLPIPQEFYQRHFFLSGVRTYAAFRF